MLPVNKVVYECSVETITNEKLVRAALMGYTASWKRVWNKEELNQGNGNTEVC